MSSSLMQVRVTGVLIEAGSVLIVQQRVSPERTWSLPGGRVEQGETLEEAVVREMLEETGLATEVVKLLYVCDIPASKPSVLHITFLLRRVTGEIRLPTNELDANPIGDVRMVPCDELYEYGFSEQFCTLVRTNFLDAGSYKGLKRNIGL